MVGPVRLKEPVRSQTQTSPPPADAIIDSSRSRTGSPSALNMGAKAPAWSASSGLRTTGAHALDGVSSRSKTRHGLTLAEPSKLVVYPLRSEGTDAHRQNALAQGFPAPSARAARAVIRVDGARHCG